MTGTVLNLTPTEAVVASDTLTWNKHTARDNGRASKLYPLPHLNAVLTGGNPIQVIGDTVGEILKCRHRTLDALRADLPTIMADAYGALVDPVCACSFVLVAPGRAWLYQSDDGFGEMAFPRGLYTDPTLDGDGARRERYGGDDHAMRLMRRMRDEAARNIGGQVTRLRLTSAGMDTAIIGDLDATDPPPTQPATAHAHALSPGGAAKVGRNQLCPCGSGRKAKRCCQA